MSDFLNKIPVSPITSFGNPSVPNNATFGTNFSILQTGGYMEVYDLSGLTYTIPPATTGIIEFSGNSVPIQLVKGSGSVFSPDVLTLNSDNISSGRRKLGMLVYVYETNKIYQFRIDNYDTLWNNATGATGPGGQTVVISDYGTTVKNNSAAGIAFISAWTSSTISGIGGYNDTNASWRVLQTGGGETFTGGTVSGGTIFTGGLTANTISATTYQNLPKDIFVTGGTYNNGTATFTNNSGGTFGVSGFSTSTGTSFTGGTVSGATNFTGGLTSTTISATTISATTYLGLPTNVSDSYIFSSNNSDIGGYEQMVILPLFVPNAIASIVTTVSTSPTLLANFATNLNYPNTSVIPSGIVTVHFETQKNTGSNTYECFAEIYKRNLAGTETLLGTSDMTSVIATNVVIQQTVSILLPTNVTILTTDRLVVKIYANILSGVNRDITLFYDDSTNSRLQLPVASVSIAGLVPYSGATTNVNLGNNNLTANNITATTISATTYQNLPSLPLSGGTVSGATTFTNGLTANTFSATTIVGGDIDYLLMTSFRNLYNY
jgi:hypothetical protein